MIIGPHNQAAYSALKSKAAIITICGPAGVGKSYMVAQTRREGDALIDIQPGLTLDSIPDAKRVVITAHKHPRKLTLPDRVIARLACGVIVKHESWPRNQLAKLLKGAELPEEASEAVLDWVTTPREIQGALTTWKHTEGDWRARLRAFIGPTARIPRSKQPEQIINVICTHYGVKLSDLMGRRRVKAIVWPRQVAYYLIHAATDLTFNDIGKLFNRDHSTMIYGVNKVQRKLLGDPALQAELEMLGKRAEERHERT